MPDCHVVAAETPDTPMLSLCKPSPTEYCLGSRHTEQEIWGLSCELHSQPSDSAVYRSQDWNSSAILVLLALSSSKTCFPPSISDNVMGIERLSSNKNPILMQLLIYLINICHSLHDNFNRYGHGQVSWI